MINFKLTIVYNGKNYYGWQKQKLTPTIQQTIEDAFKTLYGISYEIPLIGAGRTDSGVHAVGQTANIKLPKSRFDEKYIFNKINSILPLDIKINSIKTVDKDFNARFDAKKREYRYFVLSNSGKLPILNQFSYYYPFQLNYKLIKKCLKYFKGKHDFSSFSNSDKECNPIRKIYLFRCVRKKDYLMFRIIANSYLEGMVRNILGTILDINKKGQNPVIIKEIFKLKNNKYCGNKAPAKGLFLYRVYY